MWERRNGRKEKPSEKKKRRFEHLLLSERGHRPRHGHVLRHAKQHGMEGDMAEQLF